ncbi:MAG: MerR family transcriptional regulator [Spirochaetaceae bacterium]|jgi:DNA-binding transcriptional MerR regulator|nr:MerR family transcriptional regulator [Spirochaetaceae bacterium]
MISIGEFSRVSNLTVKTLRYYHEVGILMPGKIDDNTGYRYYDNEAFSRVETITLLKSLGFSINEIKKIFEDCTTDEDLSEYINNKICLVEKQMEELRTRKKNLTIYKTFTSSSFVEPGGIKETRFGGFWISSISFKGTYEQIGEKFRHMYKSCGAAIRGNAMSFYYDMEYKEKDAHIEAVLPVSGDLKKKGIHCREIKESRAVSLTHKGSYGTQGVAYMALFAYCREKGYTVRTPLIESYIRGPGMFFKGNESKYLTKIFILID